MVILIWELTSDIVNVVVIFCVRLTSLQKSRLPVRHLWLFLRCINYAVVFCDVVFEKTRGGADKRMHSSVYHPVLMKLCIWLLVSSLYTVPNLAQSDST